MKRLLLFLTFTILCLCQNVMAQGKVTGMQGKVVDAETGEALPFVQVGFVGTKIGTSTDMDGKFRVTNTQGATTLRFQMMGYLPQEITLVEGKVKSSAKIEMIPKTNVMHEVVITASKKEKTRYRRRHNPAIELVENVIAHKDQNRLQSADRYRIKIYDKTILALDNFHPDFENNKLWHKFNFIEKYIDETPYDAMPILTISMHEQMQQQSYRKKPKQLRTLITAKRMDGVDNILGKEGIDASLSQVFVPIDIYDNDIELMLNHFTSPLNSTIATTFYKYFITDTVEIDGKPCVELSFVPLNIRSYGFTGQMYIALDSTYAVTRYSMTVSKHVNLNFVRDLTIIQTYKASQSDSSIQQPPYLPDRCDTYGRMYVHKRLQEVYAHQVRVLYDYDLSPQAEMLPYSLFPHLTNVASLPRTKMLRREWNTLRPIQLSPKETVIDSLRYELMRLPEMRVLKKTAEISITGYIPTRNDRDSSKFDIGPVYNFFSWNHEEGIRLRIGGMTTAALNPKNFAEGYLAYGFRDQRPKFNLDLIHTFDEKDHHSHETPMSQISLSAAYDLMAPGQSFDVLDRDNIFASTNKPHKVQYVAETMLRLRKEWPSHIKLDTWVAGRMYEPSGTLQYLQYQEDGSLKEVSRYSEAEWMGRLTFSPNLDPDSKRPGGATAFNLKKDAPTINLTHHIGLMEGGFRYQMTDFTAEKRFWLGAFGHIDARLKSGIIWNRVPYIKLYFPNGNDSRFLSESSFNSMIPTEFVADQYVSLLTTYHLKGWILNNIPLIKRLRLREVAGFNIVYGGLSIKNNPDMENNVGLFKLPENTKPLGDIPYMEYSIGIENILRFIRIDYIRRITYNEGMSSKEKGFIKISFQFSI